MGLNLATLRERNARRVLTPKAQQRADIGPTYGLNDLLKYIGGSAGAEVMDPYAQHDWTYACIEAITRAVTSVPLFAVTGEEQNPKRTNSEWQKFFDIPNPYLDRSDFWRATIAYLYTQRGARWVLIGATGPRQPNEVPREAWPVPAGVLQPLTKDNTAPRTITEPVVKWRATAAGYTREFEAHQVVDLKFFNPSNPLVGFSPVDPAQNSINQGYAAQAWNASFFVNNCDPGGWLKIPGALAPDKEKQLLDSWNEQHRGPTKRGKTALLKSGADFVVNPRSAKDSEFIEGQKLSRESVLAVFGVPKAILGLVEGVTYSNYEESVAIFYSNTIVPLLSKFEDAIHSRVMGGGDEWADFDTSQLEAMRAGFGEKIAQASGLLSLGYSLDQAAKRVGLGMPAAAVGLDANDPLIAALQGNPGTEEHRPDANATLTIVKDVVAGALPAESAKAILVSSFGLTAQEASAIIDPALTLPTPPDGQKGLVISNVIDAPFVRHTSRWLREKADRDRFIIHRLETFILPYERKMDANTRRYFRALQEDTRLRFEAWLKKNNLKAKDIATLSPDDLDAILFNRERWDSAIKAMARPTLGETVVASLKSTAHENDGIQIKVGDPRITDLMGNVLGTLVKSNVTAQGAIRAAVNTSMAQGETIIQLQERLMGVAPFNPYFAQRIARTETAFASSGARFAQYGEDGIEQVEWMNSADDAVRESHSNQPTGSGGQVVTLGEKFKCGLIHPHEIGGDAAEVIQCRCDLLTAAEY